MAVGNYLLPDSNQVEVRFCLDTVSIDFRPFYMDTVGSVLVGDRRGRVSQHGDGSRVQEGCMIGSLVAIAFVLILAALCYFCKGREDDDTGHSSGV